MWNPLKDWVGWVLLLALVGGSGWGYFHPREDPHEAAIREWIERVGPRAPDWWKSIVPYAGRVSSDRAPEAFRRQLETIPAAAGHLLAANWCQEEVIEGGFEQFFSSSTGIAAPEAVAGFRAMGLEDAADVLQQAMDALQNPYPRDHGRRNKLLVEKLREHRNRQPFEELNHKFVELMSSPDSYLGRFEAAANRYARENLK